MSIINFLRNLFREKEAPLPNGLVPSPVDYRDIPLSAVNTGVNETPGSYHLPYKLTVKMQGQKPICVACSGATIKEYLEKKEGNNIEFDEDWLYAECKKIDGLPDVKGTFYRVALQVLKNIGCMPKGGDPKDLTTIAKYRIAGYAQITPITFENIKRAVYEHGAVLMGFAGSNGGWQTALIRAPKQGEEQWGHATTAVAFDVDFVNGQNSWSEQWGEDGFFKFTKDYLPFEAWAVISDLPNNWQDLLPQPAQKPKHTFSATLLPGQNNDEIKILQDCLKWLGCMEKSQESTGLYGEVTKNAVKVFQGRYNISQTGNVGPITVAQLNKLFQ